MNRRLVLAGLALLLLLVGIGAGGWAVYQRIGRTPTELIAHAKHRLDGHPKLEFVALPFLNALDNWFAVDGVGSKRPPFAVPRLAANPAPAASRTLVSTTRADSLPGVLRVGPGRAIASIGMAAKLAKDGDVVEIDPGDYVADVAVWKQAEITVRGMGPRVRLIATGAHAEGKAIWVMRGRRMTVENIDFIGARVPDGNGAGIRQETGHLLVRNCLFFNNQAGVITGNQGDTELEIESSEFGYNGKGDGFTHHVYAGRIKRLKVTGSYLHHANLGHLIKSRAARSEIAYNRLTDEAGGRASYELEFPNGGVVNVVGNILQQGSQTGNSVMLSFGAEGYGWPRNRLSATFNTLVNDHPHGGSFFFIREGADGGLVQHNLIVGEGRMPPSDDVTLVDNPRLDWTYFALAARHDYRLRADRREALMLRAAPDLDGALMPRQEYRHPTGLLPLTAPPRYPGAIQTVGP